MLSTWSIHYDRWVIDDGEPEREVGECFRWPVVAFGSMDRLTHAAAHVQSATDVEDYSYNVVAKVVHVSTSTAVIDFGLRAVGRSDSLPTACQAGEYVSGQIKLFFQHWCDPLPDDILESMTHEWSVKTMLADMTPYRPEDWFIRDAQKTTYEQITSTRAKNANAYVLQCCLIHAEGSPADEELHPNH
jgi:hypothetical protein